LVRWMHPQRGFMAPDLFIPMAEQSGLIGALTRWVLKEAIHQLAAFHAHGYRLSMAVNLSACNLHDPELVDCITALLQETCIAPEYLVLEITEGAVMSSPSDGIRNLHRLDQAGVTLAIDDFGTGYSSLAYLKQLPVDELKIDKSFVMNMYNDDNDAVIVRSTIDLAHNLGLKVTAEGVENQDTWEILSMLGCDTSQGYFMSKPLTAERLTQWLAESPWSVGSPTAFPDAKFWTSVA
jgi:EAL domain-containing protein (putative c-di-GMP-specific phosphodiesterase class I)